jgi:hypothetical protein
MGKIPAYLNKYFQSNNYIIIYPMQSGVAEGNDISLNDASMLEPFQENLEILDDIAENIARLFRKK